MNVVDSSAWLEYLSDSPNSEHFADAISDTGNLLVPTVVIYEVFKQILRQKGESEALTAAGILMSGDIIELDTTLSMNAAKMSHELKLPMADSIILATARRHGATIWTQDRDFEGLENVNYFEKSKGETDG